jgi:hypothetical protein
LHERHGLRDKKVALLDPLHLTPQPRRISAKSGQSIKPRFCHKARNRRPIKRLDLSIGTIQACRLARNSAQDRITIPHRIRELLSPQ